MTKKNQNAVQNSNQENKSVVKISENDNIKKEEQTTEKILYTCKSIVDANEYCKMAKYFPKRVYWVFVARGVFLNLLLSAVIAIISKSILVVLIFFVIYQIYLMIYYKVGFEHFIKKIFNSQLKRGEIDTSFETEFYDDYFKRKGEVSSLTIKYQDITKCVENDTNFYLDYPKRNVIVIIQKSECNLDLIDFIRGKFNDLENHLGDSSKIKKVKSYHNPKFIKNGMIILFILTIASFWGALYSVALIDGITIQHGFNFTKNLWIFWCWLPIPILSTVLGFKYKNAGFKCTKNIVAGFIMVFLLLIYGSFCLMPTFSEDYSKINNYKSVISAKIPKKGELEIQNWYASFDEDKTEYTIINAYYDQENVNDLVSSIESSNNWILSNNIKSEFKIFIPPMLYSDDDAYFSIYNKILNEYNTIPKDSGKYQIYVMKYDKSEKKLEIHEFKYVYKK